VYVYVPECSEHDEVHLVGESDIRIREKHQRLCDVLYARELVRYVIFRWV
jgi:hypothetical protein